MILMISILLLLLIIGTPIVFSMGIASTIWILVSHELPLISVPQKLFAGMEHYHLLAVPVYILVGVLMEETGIAKKLINFAMTLVGHFRHGLANAAIVGEIFFSEISGSSAADTAAMGSLLIPSMVKEGYSRKLATAIIAAACGMGILVPPCLSMIVYGVLANVSIAALFAAGFLPAFLMAGALMLQLNIQARLNNLKSFRKRASLKEVLSSLKSASLPLMLPVIIFAGIFTGAFNVTEAGVVALCYALFLGKYVYKTITLSSLRKIIIDSFATSGTIIFLLAVATILGWIMTNKGISADIANLVSSFGGGKITFLISLNFIFLVLGSILEGLPALTMLVPVLLPIALELGIDPLHFGIVIVANLGVGLNLPPVGINMLIACAIGKVTVQDVARPLLPFLAVNFGVVLIITYWPWVVLVIPKLMGLY